MNKPVAWMTENGTIFDELPPISGGLIPLYTHPVKELTDEEINDCIREEASKDPCGIGWNLAFNVAKAILRKAQEK